VKAVCSKHYVAYDTAIGCGDCRPALAIGVSKQLDVPSFTDLDDPELEVLYGKSFVDGLRAMYASPVGRDANGSDVDDSELDPFCIAMLGYD
jgi:hypothetical protein